LISEPIISLLETLDDSSDKLISAKPVSPVMLETIPVSTPTA